MNEKVFKITEHIDPTRLDVVLTHALSATRNHVRNLIDKGLVFVGGAPAKQNKLVKYGDEIRVVLPPPEKLDAEAEDISLDILYEDDYLAVINKPQNMTVHPSGKNTSGTLVNALLYHIGNLSGINGVLRPGIVHRLDKDTSGLLVVAKEDYTHVRLQEQLKNKTCRRVYLALVEGVVKEDSGTVEKPLARDKNDRKKIAVSESGRKARTDWRVVERFKENTLIEFSLSTGRTHQIRVHAKYMGHPVVGDKTYGYKNQRFNLVGQLLHARELEFIHPRTEGKMTFTAPLPDYFEKTLEILRKKS